MFDRFKPVPFEPYGRRRSRWRLPRWLVLLLLGIAAGAAAVIYVQERHLPPRLSAGESTRLKAAYEQADAQRNQLRAQLDETSKRLDTALAESQRATTELESSRALVTRLRNDVGAAVAAMPPDPRGGNVEVRSGQFSVNGGALAYQVVLSRAQGTGKALDGTMQLVVSADPGGGAGATLKPVEFSIGAHEIVRGSVSLPDGLKPRQVTIRLQERNSGRPLGMRVMLVQ